MQGARDVAKRDQNAKGKNRHSRAAPINIGISAHVVCWELGSCLARETLRVFREYSRRGALASH